MAGDGLVASGAYFPYGLNLLSHRDFLCLEVVMGPWKAGGGEGLASRREPVIVVKKNRCPCPLLLGFWYKWSNRPK